MLQLVEGKGCLAAASTFCFVRHFDKKPLTEGQQGVFCLLSSKLCLAKHLTFQQFVHLQHLLPIKIGIFDRMVAIGGLQDWHLVLLP